MRDAEEVAREVLGCRLTLADDGRNVCEIEHGGAWDCADEEQRIADLVRARDAEMRAAVLAEFTEEGTRWCSCADAPWSSRCSDDCVEGRPRVRLASPWEPEPRHIDQGEHHD